MLSGRAQNFLNFDGISLKSNAFSARPYLGDLYAESGQTWKGSLTAVSKSNLQENMRWKALAEIYTIHSFAPFSKLKFFVKNC